MKVSVVSLLVFLLPCNVAGYGLLSLLMGKLEEEGSAKNPELSHVDHLYETREAKNVDIETDKEVGFLTEEGSSNSADNLYETREAKDVDIETGEERGLLDTLNLSLAGNLDISNAVGQVSIAGVLSPLKSWDINHLR